MDIVIFLVVGLVAGWLAGQLVKGGGFGLVGDLVVGLVGALIGGFLLPRFIPIIGTPILNAIIVATIGAVILLLLLRLIKRAEAPRRRLQGCRANAASNCASAPADRLCEIAVHSGIASGGLVAGVGAPGNDDRDVARRR
jgi:uncharacterized membrane protein YeaQ/YmgE (transglycosylase-associated protein family)